MKYSKLISIIHMNKSGCGYEADFTGCNEGVEKQRQAESSYRQRCTPMRENLFIFSVGEDSHL